MTPAFKMLMRTAAAAALAAPLSALAPAYPGKPIRLVTEFIGGSGGDSLLRVVMGPMGESMGQPIVLDSRPGAGGLVAAEQVARAQPDGYTLLEGALNVRTVRPHLTRTDPFDCLKELTPNIEAIDCSVCQTTAGNTVPAHSPKPILAAPGRAQ